MSERDGPEYLFQLWKQLSKNDQPKLQPWLKKLIEERLTDHSLEILEQAIRGALSSGPYEARRRRTLSKIFKTPALIRAWIRTYQHRATARSERAAPQRLGPIRLAGEPLTCTRLYLQVPFSENDAAKKAGAKFDLAKKKWFFDYYASTPLRKLQPLTRWGLPERMLQSSAAQPTTESDTYDESARWRRKEIENEVSAEGLHWQSQAYRDEVNRRCEYEGL